MPDLSILQLTRYARLGGSSRLRFYDFAPALEAEGIKITPAPFFDDDYITGLYRRRRRSPLKLLVYYIRRITHLLQAGKYDLVWLEKEALPWVPIWIEKNLLRAAPYVIDFDDAWFHRYDQHKNPALRWLLAKKFPELVSGAKAVIAGSPYLADWAKTQNAHNIIRIPTTVDLSRYKVKENFSSGFAIGWMGSPSTANYLHLIGGALSALQKEGATINLVGSGQVTLPAEAIVVPWAEDTEAADLTGFDVGIMPLTSDSWSEGKCAYKLIQYMAAGLPVVASPVGMNREVVEQGVNGFLAGSDQEWIAALKTLRDDPDLRRRMGRAGRKIAEERYSLTGNTELLVQTLRDAATKK